MKRTALTIIFILSSALLFSSVPLIDDWRGNNYGYEEIGRRFEVTDVRMKGMGGAGIALSEASNGIFVNPSSLASGKFSFSYPSLSLTVHHVHDAAKKTGGGRSILEMLVSGSFDDTELYSALLDLVGTERAPLGKLDAYTSFVTPYGLGLGLYASDTLYTYSGALINETDFSFALGYGHAFHLGDFTLKAGAVMKFNYLIFSSRMKANEIIGKKLDKITTEFAYGYAVPVTDIAFTLSWKGLSASLVYKNLFGDYHMGVVESAVTDYISVNMSSVDYSLFKIENRGELDCGLGYEITLGDFTLAAAADLNDILTMNEYDDNFSEPGRRFLKRFNIGFEAGWRDIAALRFGMNAGYFTLGSSIQYFGVKIESAYYWEETGSQAGERGLDGFSIRFNVGV